MVGAKEVITSLHYQLIKIIHSWLFTSLANGVYEFLNAVNFNSLNSQGQFATWQTVQETDPGPVCLQMWGLE